MSIPELGGIILVGRRANFMLKRDQGYNIRVIASRPKRIANLIRFRGINNVQAEEETKKSDQERSNFVRNNFDRDIDDPKAYDVIINTTYMELTRQSIWRNWGLNPNLK